MPIGIFALSLAAFAVGTSEFVIAGLLPNIASDFGVSIPTTGLLVTVYALSVAIGGPFFALFTSSVRRKPLIVFLLCIFVPGQAFCALAPSYAWLMAGRVFTACTHGLFFGAGGVAAMNIAGPQRRSMAMALFLGGITVASLFGIPVGSAIGNAFGWRWTFGAVGLCGLFAAALVSLVLPQDARDNEKDGSLKAELRALNHHQVYLSYLAIALVMVGALAFATYQVPALIAVSGVAQDRTPLYLMISGIGAVIGIYVGGRAGDWKLMPSLMAILLAQVGAAILLWLVMPQALWMAFGMFISSAASWALNAPVQSRILSAAHAAPQLASTLISTAYNLGIGGGAWVGALCIDGGLSYQTLPIVGAVCSLLAAGVAAVSWMLDGRDGAGQPVGDRLEEAS